MTSSLLKWRVVHPHPQLLHPFSAVSTPRQATLQDSMGTSHYIHCTFRKGERGERPPQPPLSTPNIKTALRQINAVSGVDDAWASTMPLQPIDGRMLLQKNTWFLLKTWKLLVQYNVVNWQTGLWLMNKQAKTIFLYNIFVGLSPSTDLELSNSLSTIFQLGRRSWN